MATEVPGFKLSLIAAADLSGSQYKGVAVDSAGKAALAGAGAVITGVLQDKPTAGQIAEIMVTGVTKGVLGGTVASGAQVMMDASGDFITATATNAAVGICLVGGGDTEIAPILLTGPDTPSS